MGIYNLNGHIVESGANNMYIEDFMHFKLQTHAHTSYEYSVVCILNAFCDACQNELRMFGVVC